MRNYQRELTHDIYDAMGKRQNIIVHAPTGTGKTDSAISAALTYALANNLSVFFLTPKISQHRIAIEVARGISEKYKLGFRAIDIIGRRYACIDETLSDLDHEGFYQTCEKKRGKKTCEFYGKAIGYSKIDEARANILFKKVFMEAEKRMDTRVLKTSQDSIQRLLNLVKPTRHARMNG